MLTTIIYKELKGIIVSPKFFVTFAVCSVLMLLSVFIGIKEYRAVSAQYETGVQLADQRAHEATGWHGLRNKAYRDVDPMQILVSGLSNDIGRWSNIDQFNPVKLKNSIYSDDPIFAVFRYIDFAFIVQVVLSLFAILFTYDAISGEREDGTLRLVFSNAVNRATYIIGKSVGAWLGLVIPIGVPILLSLLMLLLFRVPLDGEHWVRILSFLGISLLLFTFFIIFGVFISALTRTPNISFLVSLVLWVCFVLIIPRAGVMAAGQLVRVPRVAEIEGQRDGFARDKWAAFQEESTKRWREFNNRANASDGEEDDDAMWARIEAEDSARRVVHREIESFETRLQEDLRYRKAAQQRLAFSLSRISPASAYRLAAMTLAGTDVGIKTRNEEALNTYREDFVAYVDRKLEQDGMSGALTISFSSDDGLKIGNSRTDQVLDISDMPLYAHPVTRLSSLLQSLIVDIGLLAVFTLVTFAGAFVSFLRYDVR